MSQTSASIEMEAGRGQRPSPLELEALKVLWTLGSGTVADVRDALEPQRELAYTTVLTLLDRLAGKGAVRREKLGTRLRLPSCSESGGRIGKRFGALGEGLLSGFARPLVGLPPGPLRTGPTGTAGGRRRARLWIPSCCDGLRRAEEVFQDHAAHARRGNVFLLTRDFRLRNQHGPAVPWLIHTPV